MIYLARMKIHEAEAEMVFIPGSCGVVVVVWCYLHSTGSALEVRQQKHTFCMSGCLSTNHSGLGWRLNHHSASGETWFAQQQERKQLLACLRSFSDGCFEISAHREQMEVRIPTMQLSAELGWRCRARQKISRY